MIISKNAGFNLTKVANIIALTWRDREAAFILIFVYAQMDENPKQTVLVRCWFHHIPPEQL